MNTVPTSPHFAPIQRLHKTEKELNAPVSVVEVAVYGKYTKRGEHRKEVIEADFDAVVEVPADFNKGHLKLACNRYVRNKLKGIRVRTFQRDEQVEPKALDHKRRVRDFMSDKGLRDNVRLERNYKKQIEQRNAEQQALAAGQPPQFMDSTQYGDDGLLPVRTDKYVDV